MRKRWGDAGHHGQTKVIHAAAPKAQDMTSRCARYKGQCRLAGEAQEPHLGTSAIQGGTAFSHLEASFWIYQGALSRPEEESRVAAGRLRAGHLYQHRKWLTPLEL
jgi:hypothetical protein